MMHTYLTHSYWYSFFQKLVGIILIGFWSSLSVFAQSAMHQIQVLAKPSQTEIWLRWAPTSPVVWRMGNQYGYLIERQAIKADGSFDGEARVITTSPVKPYTKEAFQALLATEPKAEVLEEVLYGNASKSTANGEGPAALLKQRRESENRFGLALFVCDLSTQVASAAGLFWVDKTVTPGSRYVYRIKLVRSTANAPVEPGIAVVQATAEVPLIAPKDLTATFGDQTVRLEWFTKLHKGVYSAYIIEKSTDGKTFQSVTDLPYLNMTENPDPDYAYYIDSLQANYQTYTYRIRGITPFGETSPPSEIVSGQGKNDMTGTIVIEKAEVQANKKVLLQWRLPAEHHKQVKGYIVSRASRAEGPYQDLQKKPLPVTQTQYTDIPTYQNTYYQVRLIGKDDKELTRSFPYLAQLEDTTPPAIPLQLTGRIDSSGIVSLRWQNNADADLLGYRVFRANNPTEEFREVTTQIVLTPLFTDTIPIHTLTRSVYYQVVAVDQNYNPSDYSATLALKRPDVVPPTGAVFLKTESTSEGIALTWENSPSRDVATCELFRANKATPSRPVSVLTWKGSDEKTTFLDQSPAPGAMYTYVLVVTDSAGLHTKSFSKSLFYETGIRAAVQQVQGKVDRENRKIALQWTYPLNGVTKCIIYRSQDQAPMRIHQTLVGNPGNFEDKSLSPNHSYTYQIQLYFKAGIQTQISQPLQITY